MDWDVIIRISGPIVGAALGWALKEYTERKPKVIYYLLHASAVSIKPEEQGPLVHDGAEMAPSASIAPGLPPFRKTG